MAIESIKTNIQEGQPSPELIDAILEMKRRNPRFGYQGIAQELTLAFGVEIDNDTVRRVSAKHYRPDPSNGGASWLTFLAHAKDSLWSVDLFRCESLILRSHWVMVVMDQFTRRIIGFAVCAGPRMDPESVACSAKYAAVPDRYRTH